MRGKSFWPMAFGVWLLAGGAAAQEVFVSLHEGWSFQQVGKEQWHPAEVPGTVHDDLLRNGLIPDPMRNANIDSVQWVENEDWIYRSTFTLNDSLTDKPNIDLVFKGLDTFAEVYLNDSLLGKADNMFRQWEWPVKQLLRSGANELKVVFRSVIKEGAKLRDAYGIQLPHDNDPSGVSPYVRKAAYQFGWDFAPRLVGCGIWREVGLRGRAPDGFGGSNFTTTQTSWEYRTWDVIGPMIRDRLTLDRGWDSVGTRFQFWEPHGPLGDRKPIFMKGCNLIPPSMSPGAVDSTWVTLAHTIRSAGMNMVRVWAGGVYPPKVFFKVCKDLDIYVWQDVMLGNMGPAAGWFNEAVMKEVKEVAVEVDGYRSFGLWCGNNELDVAWKNWGWQERYRLGLFEQIEIANGYRGLFEKDLRSACGRSGVDYTPTSPLSNWGSAEGLKSGDLHYWGVWHGDSAFSSFRNNVGRFVSEYGFQSYPDSVTLAHYIDPEHLYLGSPMLAKRQKSYKTDKPIWTAIEREMGEKPTTLGRFIDCSQVMQAEAYRIAIWAHRTNQPHCMGTLYWQLNDVWAAPTWSTIDVDGRWKAAHYEVKRSYADRVLAFEPTATGGTALELWSDTELKGDSVVLELWSDAGLLLERQVHRVEGSGKNRLVEWSKDGFPPGIVAYAFGCGADARCHRAEVLKTMDGPKPELTLTPVPTSPGEWEAICPVPVRMVEVLTGRGEQPSDNWFPLVPGHPKRFRMEPLDAVPQLSTFLR